MIPIVSLKILSIGKIMRTSRICRTICNGFWFFYYIEFEIVYSKAVFGLGLL